LCRPQALPFSVVSGIVPQTKHKDHQPRHAERHVVTRRRKARLAIEQTDWPQIAALYGELARRSPSPVIEVNRAVAVGLADGPLAGLAILAPVLASGELDGYGPLHTAHADLLDRAGRSGEATAAWARALEATGNSALREALERRVAGRDQQERPGS
jgi:predicted RNA polymerase sigma factor